MFSWWSGPALVTKVAILTTSSEVGTRLEPNVIATALPYQAATVLACTREHVTKAMLDSSADGALCADGDAISIWSRDDEKVVLKDVVVERGVAERDLSAARATLILRSEDTAAPSSAAPGPAQPPASAPAPCPVCRDAAGVQPVPRTAPRAVFTAGMSLASSRHGSSAAIDLAVEIGVARAVALVPWVSIIPVERTAENNFGKATFRPTLFGFGASIPFLPPSSRVVPRLGAGFGVLWMHVTPESAVAPAIVRSPEDLLAPVAYASGSLSFRVVDQLRLAAVAMGGFSSHELVVRLGSADAAAWGAPYANLGARAEWVLP